MFGSEKQRPSKTDTKTKHKGLLHLDSLILVCLSFMSEPNPHILDTLKDRDRDSALSCFQSVCSPGGNSQPRNQHSLVVVKMNASPISLPLTHGKARR